MTRPAVETSGRGEPAAASGPAAPGGWIACTRELAVYAGLVLATSVAAYAYGGPGLAVLVVAAWAVVSLAFLRALVPAAPEQLSEQSSWRSGGRSSFLGFWRKRSMVGDATTSMVSYDSELRPTLQHFLAARLADRHGVSLYADPAAAQRLVLPGPRDGSLWFWLDPQRPAETRQGHPGIPPRTLATILDRLERL
jgi:hypothetical protein